MKKSPLKPGRPRRLTEEEKVKAWEFKLSVQRRYCVVCGRMPPRLDAHHGIEAQYLRQHFPERVYDVRNAVPICPEWVLNKDGTGFEHRTCHGDHTSAKKRIPRASLPESVEAFAKELGLEHLLDRYYPVDEGCVAPLSAERESVKCRNRARNTEVDSPSQQQEGS